MTQAAAQWAAFAREAARNKVVFTVRDPGGGHPAPMNAEGKRSLPFWSSRKRVQKIVNSVPAYSEFKIDEVQLDDFLGRWLPGLERDGFLVGVNWTGNSATGYDIAPADVRLRVGYELERLTTQ
jgi:hypothetical protein